MGTAAGRDETAVTVRLIIFCSLHVLTFVCVWSWNISSTEYYSINSLWNNTFRRILDSDGRIADAFNIRTDQQIHFLAFLKRYSSILCYSLMWQTRKKWHYQYYVTGIRRNHSWCYKAHSILSKRQKNPTHNFKVRPVFTRCSAIAERPRCRVRYSFGQKWKTGTGRQYFTDIIGLSSTTVINRPENLSNSVKKTQNKGYYAV